MKNDDIIVQTSLRPFSTTFTTVTLNDCKTVKDVVDLSVPYYFKDSKLVVTHNGEIIDCEHWETTSVKDHDLVGLNFVPTGGGGKNPLLQIAVMIAVTVATIYTGGAAAGAFAAAAGGAEAAAAAGFASASTAFWTGVGYTAATVGIGMVGSLAANALASTPKQSRGSNLAESQTSFIEGASNAISKYGVIPINLGTNRMFPNQAAVPYAESYGKIQYARQLFTYGYGKLEIAERKIGETDIDSFSDIEWEDKLNGDLNTGTKLYASNVTQTAFNVGLTKAEGYVVKTTEPNSDEAELDITFQGLCEYNNEGTKLSKTVEFEIQFAPTGTQNWSVGTAGVTISDTVVMTEDLSNTFTKQKKHKHNQWTNTFIVLSLYNGGVYTVQNTCQIRRGVQFPPLSNDEVVLGYIRGEDKRHGKPLAYVDNHNGLYPKYIGSKNDFPVTVNLSNYSNVIITVGGGFVNGVSGKLVVTASTTQSLRKSKRLTFPTTGQYDIRIRRLTNDTNSDKIIDKAYLTAIRSINHSNPVKFANISGTAMRIKATDQLNGTVDSYNCIVSTYLKGYDPDTDTWVDDVISSNPADIFRYVLQSPAFAKCLPDSQIDLEKLAEWWVYCDSIVLTDEVKGLTYDRVIDYDTSVDDVLNDICAAGLATLSKVNNIYSVIIDNERPLIKGMVTPRNSWDYQGNIVYPDIPHALRLEFRNADTGYETDERIVYADGYDESNAELYERLQFPSCTDAELAYYYGRRYFATALLQPETHTFKMDFEYMTFNRGDRITLVNDVILVGVGQGRIKELLVDDVDNPTSVLGFTIDDKVDIPDTVVNLGVRIRDNNGTQGYTYHLLQQINGVTDTFTFSTPVAYEDAPAIESLCAFVEDGKELDLIITGIKANKDLTATITAIDYAPTRFNPIGEIPDFDSKITVSSDFYKPYAPILASAIQTDESVMIKNSDGSLTSVAVISLDNRNSNDVNVIVYVNKVGDTEWFTPTTLKRDPNQVVISGLQDGERYNFEIRYQRQSGLQLMSDSLTVNNVFFIGGSTNPSDVQNFHVTVTNGLGFFEWTPNPDVDISHYVIKFSSQPLNVTWENSQLVVDKIKGNTFTNIVDKGKYLIKAVDLSGNESENATVITCTDSGAFKNVVEQSTQETDWDGVKDNIVKVGNYIQLDDSSLHDGYYYFYPAYFDLGAVYENSLSLSLTTLVESLNARIRSIDEIRDYTNPIRTIQSQDYSSQPGWKTELQMNLSDDGTTWKGWETALNSHLKFRAIKFRIYIHNENENYNVAVTHASVTIDMPDRYEHGEGVTMSSASTGGVVTYGETFRNNPSVNITVQNGAVDDKIEFVTKNNKGFTFKVFNATLNSYVTRTFDWLAAGYGREIE